jgi:Fe-S-cluster containining protein
MKPNGARPENRPYFFDAGLRFGCTQCGHCCTGATGTVFMNAKEAERIARHLGLDVEAFLQQYAYAVPGGHSLREVGKNFACIMFKDEHCTIYEVRPTQCRTFPFWSENVRSENAWRKACRQCPGIGQGRLYGREEILAIAADSMDETAVADGTGPQPVAEFPV